jgi:homoserine O-acetyltransferase
VNNETDEMSAELSLPLQPRRAALQSATSPTPATVQSQQGELALPEPFVLESGAALRNAKLAWQCVGPADAPLIVVLGGISAHRRLCAENTDQGARRGWWESQCGAGKALDTNRYRLLGIDWLGGCDASTGPRHGRHEINPSRAARKSLPLSREAGEGTGWGGTPHDDFPAISTSDQARALLLLLNRLGVRRVHLLVGASYGGNVAQQLAALLGDRLRRLVLLSAAHRPAQFGIALRHVQRAILDLGGDTGSTQALALARSLAVLGYRTAEGVEQRFNTDSTQQDDPADSVTGWIDHHGKKFVQRFDADAYRCLGRSLDTHEIDPASVRVPTTLFAVREDLTVSLSLLHEYAQRAGERCELVEISSNYGHDAFLKEEAVVGALFARALETTP